jgi:uncharacterized protein (DUF2267 family)
MDFIKTVEQTAGIPEDDAKKATRAVLRTLGERLSGGEAQDIAEELPEDLGSWIVDGDQAQAFDLDEFIRRVADREGVVEDVAQRHARGVFAALGRFVSPDELHDMASELPNTFGPLLEAATPAPPPEPRPPHVVPAEEFYANVAERGGLETEAAKRATDAVLETLAYRISAGQVEDMAPWLPAELHPALKRGIGESRQAVPLTLAQFLQRVAALEGTTVEEAEEHSRAVLTTLAGVLPEEEFRDATAQLPDEYRRILRL